MNGIMEEIEVESRSKREVMSKTLIDARGIVAGRHRRTDNQMTASSTIVVRQSQETRITRRV